jgi:hypothetical protein
MPRTVDRVVTTPHGGAYLAIIGLLAGAGLSVFMKDSLDLRPTLFLAIAFALLGYWFVPTWRRLWRPGNDRWGEIVFNLGVRRLGPFGWVITALLFSGTLWYKSQDIKVAIFYSCGSFLRCRCGCGWDTCGV